MSFHDPISDLLTRIRNATMAKHRYVDIVLSRQVRDIAEVLRGQGYIKDILCDDSKRKMRVFLKYGSGQASIIRGLKRVSKPGLRRYVGYRSIPKVLSGLGTAIISTSKGIRDGESAREDKTGGELLAFVW